METSLLEIIKLGFLIVTPLATLGWHLYRKLENEQEKMELRMDLQDKKMTEIEKAYIEMKTEFKFTSRDIKDIKELLTRLTDKKA